MAKPSSNLPKGVRGPSTPGRAAMERKSLPLMIMLTRMPKWIIVVLMAAFLFLGLIQTGDLAWLGGIFLSIVTLFLAWLLVLAWPVLPGQARFIRLVVVLAAAGITVFKFMGNF